MHDFPLLLQIVELSCSFSLVRKNLHFDLLLEIVVHLKNEFCFDRELIDEL